MYEYTNFNYQELMNFLLHMHQIVYNRLNELKIVIY